MTPATTDTDGRQPDPARAALETRLRWLRWAVAAVLLLAVVAFIAVGANNPEDPRLEGSRAGIPGFEEVAFRVGPSQYCALLAESEAQRQQGLMGRRDLAGYDAMVFRFPEDTRAAFYMRNVPVPLTVAWFDASGRFVSSADMAPCPDDEANCPTYAPERPYRLALEVPGGGLARIGVGQGAVLEVGGACADR